MRSRRKVWVPGWALLLLALVSFLGAYLGVSGYVMAGSSTISNPEALAHWQRMAAIYGALAVLSFLVLLASVLLGMWRIFQAPPDDRSGAV